MIILCMMVYRLDRVEMRRWVASEVTYTAHDEAKNLLHHIDKDRVCHSIARKTFIPPYNVAY